MNLSPHRKHLRISNNPEVFYDASKSISRVLYSTDIYLDLPLPTSSSHLPGTAGPAMCPSTVLLRIEFTERSSSQSAGELLPRLSTLTGTNPAVSLCCTCPEVAFGGRYPLFLPCGARTFLTDGPFAPPARLSNLLAEAIVTDLPEKVKPS